MAFPIKPSKYAASSSSTELNKKDIPKKPVKNNVFYEVTEIEKQDTVVPRVMSQEKDCFSTKANAEEFVKRAKFNFLLQQVLERADDPHFGKYLLDNDNHFDLPALKRDANSLFEVAVQGKFISPTVSWTIEPCLNPALKVDRGLDTLEDFWAADA